ncbi:MAG: hypothetical protein SPL73_09140 [Cyanobacteriota bacterium]|nr:hypothetical protein [Cyanobacteriota bacterium]MDY6382330.1 hypothetical protein [Cyanobacteriota bacterium]
MKYSIIAEKRISVIQYSLILGFCCLLFSLIFMGFKTNPYSEYVFIILLVPFMYLGFKEINNKEEYVERIEISDDYLIIKYKNNCIKTYRFVKIRLNEIKEFKLKVVFYPNSSRYKKDLTQLVNIKYADKVLDFCVSPTIGIDSRKWSFSLRLLSISRYIPNFSYQLVTNERGYFMEKDINYFYKHNKKYPFYRLIVDELGKDLILLFITILIIALGTIIFVLFSL